MRISPHAQLRATAAFGVAVLVPGTYAEAPSASIHRPDGRGDGGPDRRLFAFEPDGEGLMLVSDVPHRWPERAPWTDGREQPDDP